MTRKALVIGLDGVPAGLLERFATSGTTPNIAALIARGRFGPMCAPLPPVSSVSWSSFMTGLDPSGHGIFGFTDLGPDLELQLPSFLDLQAPTLFDLLGRAGRRSIVVNMPATYPARQIPGVLISGFVAPDLGRAVYPQSLLPWLSSLGYSVDIDLPAARRDHDLLFRSLHASLGLREHVVHSLWRDCDWDLLALVITGTDRLHHFLFDAGENPDDPRHGQFLEYYRAVDALVGRLADRFEAETRSGEGLTVLLSDHGFTGLEVEVHLNRILERNGLLAYAAPSPTLPSQIDPERTRAFVLDPGRVHVNARARYRRGIVPEGERGAVLAQVLELFREAEHQGQPVVEQAILAREAYSGPLLARGPDAVLVPRRGVELKGAPGNGEVFAHSGLRGTHTHDDAFYLEIGGEGAGPAPDSITQTMGRITAWIEGGSPCP